MWVSRWLTQSERISNITDSWERQLYLWGWWSFNFLTSVFGSGANIGLKCASSRGNITYEQPHHTASSCSIHYLWRKLLLRRNGMVPRYSATYIAYFRSMSAAREISAFACKSFWAPKKYSCHLIVEWIELSISSRHRGLRCKDRISAEWVHAF